jgi:membrane-bound serine protease (ClpP class)
MGAGRLRNGAGGVGSSREGQKPNGATTDRPVLRPCAGRLDQAVKVSAVRGFLGLAAVTAAALFLVSPASAQARPKVLAVHFATEINPVTQDWVNHQIDKANSGGYSAVVILLDTPGGLSTSMEKIYEKILASKVPVIVYVSPAGAGAASAGVFVGESADVLAMAPATNIGSSTPIDQSGGNLGSDLRRKVINHFAAKLCTLAKTNGRNCKWGEMAVRKASNLTYQQALDMHVIDVVAPTLPALLDKLDGRTTFRRHIVLHTANAQVVSSSPSFFTKFLNVLIDPNIITLLFLAGLAGIGFEIFHPGVVLPGALGAVALLTALYGFAVLPISWAGLMLLILGVVLLVIDLHVTSHGAISVAGLISLAFGAIMLFRNAPTPYHVSLPLVVGVAVGLGLLWAFAITKALQVRRRPVSVGPQTIVGAVGQARPDGMVFVNGELWQARTPEGEQPPPGSQVRVEAMDGLVLRVVPVA